MSALGNQQDEIVIQKNKNVPRVALVISVVLLLVSGALVALLVLRRDASPKEQNKAPETTRELNGTVPTPTGKISDLIPWAYADEALPTEPALPSLKELDEIYRKIRLAVGLRDFNQIKNFVSKERIWHIENPKRLVGGLSTGGMYYEAVGENGEKNFIHSPYSVLFDAPPQDFLIPQAVKRKEISDRPDILLVNQKTGISQKVSMIPWRYAAELTYSLKSEYADKGAGSVTFVYDDNKWAFQGQSWNVQYQDTTGAKGDSVTSPAQIKTVKISESGICTPGSVKIKPGDAIRWNDITGMIYTVVPSISHWDSGYLHKDSYTKQFTIAGSYVYIVQQPPRDPNKFTTCTITVE